MSKRVFWTLDDAGKLVAVLDSLMDTDDDHEKRLTALEQRGEPKPMVGICHFDSIGRQHDGPILGCPICKPAPTPATVEKFDMYRFESCGTQGGGSIYRHHYVGEIVATPINHCGCTSWSVQLPSQPVDNAPLILSPGEYRALVEHNTKAGIWERNNG